MKEPTDKLFKPQLIWPGKKEPERISMPFQTIETINENRDIDQGAWTNQLIFGENLLITTSLLNEFSGKINLIYIDPPFATGRDFSQTVQIGDQAIKVKAYKDTWGKGISSYLQMIYERLMIFHELLASNGSIYVHCDYRTSGAIRIMMDEIFGEKNFINHIIWKSAVGDTSAKNLKFIKSHDDIFFYCKNYNQYTWNESFQKYSDGSLKLYKQKDDKGYFQLIAVDNPGGGGYRYDLGCGEKTPKRGYCMPIETAKKWIAEGELVVLPNKVPRRKKYINKAGVRCQDIWTDISGSIRKEYPTQKPEKLLERIILASSNPNDIVADFFCGAGTTLTVAEKLNRRWIGCDLSRFAINLTRKRLLGLDAKPFAVQKLSEE